MTRDVTTIEIKTDTWKELNGRKEPGESFDDVVRRALGLDDDRGEESEPEIRTPAEPTERDASELPEYLTDALDEYRAHCEEHDSERAAARVAAARAIMHRLVDGGVSRREAWENVLPNYPVDGQSKKTWWDKQGKRLLADLDRVEWQSGRNEYVYTGG